MTPDSLIPITVPGLYYASGNLVGFNFGVVEPFFDCFDVVEKQFPGRKFILFAHSDPYNTQHIKSQIVKYGLDQKCFVLSGDIGFVKANKDLGVRFFSFFWHWWFANHSKKPDIATGIVRSVAELSTQRSWPVSCLNKKSSYSRLQTFYALMQQSWLDQAYVSFGLVPQGSYDPIIQLPQEQQYWYQAHQFLFPYSPREQFDWDSNCWQIDIPPYADTYLNIVTETMCNGRFATEKTVKPLAAGCLTQFVAEKDFVKLLPQLGFDVDYRGLDHGYDDLETFAQRIDYIMQQVTRVWNDIPDIWNTNLAKLKFNRDWLLSDKFGEFLLHDINDILIKQ